MKSQKILFIYSRDIELNDSGGARTTIQLINYLANQEQFEVYCLFHIIAGSESVKVTEINGKPTVEDINRAIREYHIDILMVPEGEMFGHKIKKAVEGTHCKVISALHSKPGYERIRLDILLKESLLYNKSFFKRIRALILLLFYPLFYCFYTRSVKYKMEY